MLISCKCLNFIATSNVLEHHFQKKPSSSSSNAAADETADGAVLPAAVAQSGNTTAAIMQAFLQKYPRNFVFYSQCMDFFKNTIGPLTDLTINAVNQRNLLYSLTLNVANQLSPQTHQPPTSQPNIAQLWQISICVNCNVALCAKPLSATSGSSTQYLINGALLTTNEKLYQTRSDKSFSDTFGVLIMDHQFLTSPPLQSVGAGGGGGGGSGSGNVETNARGAMHTTEPDYRGQRTRQLQQHLQQRLKQEIVETEERIQRYTEQQFALLKSFREKSEQEFKLLEQLLLKVPDQREWIDRTPPTLDVNGGGINYLSRRRNTIGSRRELTAGTGGGSALSIPKTLQSLNTTTTTTTTTKTPPPPSATRAAPSPTTPSAIDGGHAVQRIVTATNVSQRKFPNFDTPPATPEAMPMSVGNSPTFCSQQQQQQQHQLQQQRQPSPMQTFGRQSFQQQYPTPTLEMASDCLFELEGFEMANNAANTTDTSMQFFNPIHGQNYRQGASAGRHNDSDDDDSDEAEDAIDLDSSLPMTMPEDGRNANNDDNDQLVPFGKSLPVEIVNSTMNQRFYMTKANADDELDNNVDIAASIKALAKSVHGEAVFGDLPRPRLRSQI